MGLLLVNDFNEEFDLFDNYFDMMIDDIVLSRTD